MKDEGDFLVMFNDYSNALKLDENQNKAAIDMFKNAEALVDESGKKKISVQAYIEYILAGLDGLENLANKLESLDDIKSYGSVAQGFLKDLMVIISNISHLIAKGCDLNRIDEIEKTLEKFIEDMRKVFEHLNSSYKLFVKFGWTLKNSQTGEKA